MAMNGDCRPLYAGYLKDQMEVRVDDNTITVLRKADTVV